MKIAYIVDSFPAPSQTFVANQILGVQKLGHEVSVYAIDYPAENITSEIETDGLGGHTYYICPPKNYFIRLFRVFKLLVVCGWRAPCVVVRAINVFQHGRHAMSLWLLHAALLFVYSRERKFDIVHAQFGPFGLYAMKLIQIGAIEGELVISFRGYDATKELRAKPLIYSLLFKKGRLFLPVSQSIAQKLINAGCDSSKIHVHHSGIDCAKFKYTEPRLTRIGQPTRIITVGRLVEKKGIKYALDAITRVIASGRAVVYDIVGDGPLGRALEHHIKRLNLSKYVRLLGWRSHHEILAIMNASHVLLAPSITASDGDEEGIPNVVKEAMSVGLPVISTVHAGIPELVIDGESGFLVPERNVVALAERIMYLCDHPEIWSKISRTARRKVEIDFDINNLSSGLVVLYAGLIKQHGDPTITAGPIMSIAGQATPTMDGEERTPHHPNQQAQGD